MSRLTTVRDEGARRNEVNYILTEDPAIVKCILMPVTGLLLDELHSHVIADTITLTQSVGNGKHLETIQGHQPFSW